MYFTKLVSEKHQIDSQSVITELVTLKKVIKEGARPDSPELINRYISLSENYANAEPENMVSIYSEIFLTLSITATSPRIPRQWRQCCLDACYRPFLLLKKLSLTEDERRYIGFLKSKLAGIKEF